MGADGRRWCYTITQTDEFVSSRYIGAGRAVHSGQLARCRSAEDAVLCPSDMMLCVISYWVLSGAKRRQIQQLRCCALFRQAVEMKETSAKPYAKIRSSQNRFTYGANNRPTKPTTFAISDAILITEMQHLSDSPKRKNSDATRNRNDASYFH